MPTRPRRIAAAALFLASMTLTACATTTANTDSPVSADEFWQGFGTISATEVDPAGSLDELTNRSSTIVRGAIVAVGPGPTDIYELEEGDYKKPSTIVTVAVTTTLLGGPAEQVQVWISQENAAVASGPAALLPKDEFLWFLRPSDQPDLFLTTTIAGVVGLNGAGDLTTLRDPSAGETILPKEARTMEQLEQSISAILGPGS